MIRIAKTENGLVEGIPGTDPRITAFKGIPFAAPPVGKNRWRAPQPADNWEGVRQCYKFAPISMQNTPGLGTDIYCKEWHVDPEIPMGEDCLYLNVWTNARTGNEKMPVYVWFFGGAFQWGYPAEMEFDGEQIARRNVVIVTVNYRINVFGFMAHPQLTKEQGDAPSNFGMLDQLAGLKWVERNIAAFGGNPEQITIGGQSAGGGSVLNHLASPESRGHFKRAIIESGIIRFPSKDKGIFCPRNLEEAEKMGKNFFDVLGVSNLEEARHIDAKTILAKYDEYHGGDMSKRFYPIVDGIFSVDDPLSVLKKNQFADVPVLSGSTTNEFLMPSPDDGSSDGGKNFSPVDCATKATFLQREENGFTQNFYYSFDADIPGPDNPGCFHSVDLWFFFETLAKCWRPFQGRHYDLARKMCNYYTNFIKCGNPNGSDNDGTELPEWQPYTKNNKFTMVFTSEGPKGIVREESSLNEKMIKLLKDSF